MKQHKRFIMALVALFTLVTGAWATDPVVKKGSASGVTITLDWEGNGDPVTLTTSQAIPAGTEVTMTVVVSTPANDWIAKEDIVLRASQDAGQAQAPRRKAPEFINITLSGDAPTDLTETHTYTFTTPSNGANVTIDATTHSRTDLSAATVTVEAKDYNNSAQTASSITVTLGSELTAGTDYTVTTNAGGTNAGDYTVTVTGKSKYKGTKNGTFTINKVAPTITAPTAKSLTYSGVAQELINAGTSVHGTFTYNIGDGAYSSDLPTGINATSYAVHFKFTGDDNHNDIPETAVADVSIGKVELTVTANAHSITYGDAPANSGYAITGFVNSETDAVVTGSVSFTYSYSQYGDVGSYTITPVVTGLSATNYSFAAANGTLTVTQKGITVSGITASNKEYDGNTTATLNFDEIAGSGWVNEDYDNDTKVKFDYSSAAGAFADANVGNNKTVTITGVTLTGTKAGNYTISSIETATAKITAATAVVTTAPVAATGLTFNGTAQQIVNAASAAATGGTVQYCLTENGDYTATASSITQTNAGAFSFWYKAVGDANHEDSEPVQVTGGSIAKKTVGISWGATTEFDADGSDHAPTAAVTGTEDGYDCTATVTGATSAVGSHTATVTALSDATNYDLPGSGLTQVFTIVRALGVSFASGRNWATYFAAENLAIPAGLAAYTVASVSGSTVTLSDALTYIPSGVGVLLYNSAGSGSNYKASAYTGATSSFTSKLSGATTATAMTTASGYTNYILYNNAFVYAETQDASLAANRCYLPVEDAATPARELQIVFDATGISRITTDLSDVEGAWYTLDGRKLQGKPTMKGLYIVNGKKIAVK